MRRLPVERQPSKPDHDEQQCHTPSVTLPFSSLTGPSSVSVEEAFSAMVQAFSSMAAMATAAFASII
jgi:hypothetical protein